MGSRAERTGQDNGNKVSDENWDVNLDGISRTVLRVSWEQPSLLVKMISKPCCWLRARGKHLMATHYNR